MFGMTALATSERRNPHSSTGFRILEKRSRLFLSYYEDVQRTAEPESTFPELLQRTYYAGSNLAGWDRAELKGHPPHQASG